MLSFSIISKRPDFIPEQYHHCQNSTQLNYYQEHFPKFRGNLQFHKLIQKYHMTRAADGQPFRNTLHYAKQCCF